MSELKIKLNFLSLYCFVKFVCYTTSCEQVLEKNGIASVCFSDFIFAGVFKIVKLGNNINVMIQISYNSKAVNESDRN